MRFFAIPVLFGLSVLASGCGHASKRGGAATTSSTHASQALAFARCMRRHGVPDFPDPDPQGSFPPFRARELKQVAGAADAACKHLRSGGGTATPQQRQQKLAFGVKVAECLRTHGYPTMPDPTGLGSNQLPPGIDTNSPQFQTVETACEKRARKVLGLP